MAKSQAITANHANKQWHVFDDPQLTTLQTKIVTHLMVFISSALLSNNFHCLQHSNLVIAIGFYLD